MGLLSYTRRFLPAVRPLGKNQETWKKIDCNFMKISYNFETFQKTVLEIVYKL